MCVMIFTVEFEFTSKMQCMYSFSNFTRKFQGSYEIYGYFETAHSIPGRDWLSQFKAVVEPLIIFMHIGINRKQYLCIYKTSTANVSLLVTSGHVHRKTTHRVLLYSRSKTTL